MEKLSWVLSLIVAMIIIPLLPIPAGARSKEANSDDASQTALIVVTKLRVTPQLKNVIPPANQKEHRTRLTGFDMPFLTNQGRTERSAAYYARAYGGRLFVIARSEIANVRPQQAKGGLYEWKILLSRPPGRKP